jgi:hypothetical protein
LQGVCSEIFEDRPLNKEQNGDGETIRPVARRHSISIGSRSFDLPESRFIRMGAGVALIVGGMFGFVPVLGFWMIPLGVFVLSLDLHWARRIRRRFMVWLTRRYPKLAEKANGMSQSRLPGDEESR